MIQDQEWILEDYRSGKKSLELCCYVAGAGAFGHLLYQQGQIVDFGVAVADKEYFLGLCLQAGGECQKGNCKE